MHELDGQPKKVGAHRVRNELEIKLFFFSEKLHVQIFHGVQKEHLEMAPFRWKGPYVMCCKLVHSCGSDTVYNNLNSKKEKSLFV